jgi:hypothetical protein
VNAETHIDADFTLQGQSTDLHQIGRQPRDAGQLAYENECRGCRRPRDGVYHEGCEL